MFKSRTFLFIVLAVTVSAVAGWRLRTPEPRTVSAVAVERGPLASTLSATGRIATEREVVLSAALSGIVSAVKVKEGDAVRRGDALVILDEREAAARIGKALAERDHADPDLGQARLELARMRRLFEVGGEPRQAVDQAESKLASALARRRTAEEELRLARVTHDKLTVRSPIAGVVTSIAAHAGQTATPAVALLSLADPSISEIEARIDAADGALVAVGQSAVITSDAVPDVAWREQVLRLAPAVEKTDAASTVRVVLSYGGQAPALRLGQQVDVMIHLVEKSDALKIPAAAVQRRDGAPAVALFREGRIAWVPVTTGIEDLTHTEVVRGLREGDRVVLPTGKPLKEGEPVRIAGAPQ